MDTKFRIRLDMGGRVVVFCHSHPDDNPQTAPVVARVEEALARADVLQMQQRQSMTVVASAVNQKTESRLLIENALAALFGIAKAAVKEHPELSVHRRVPKPRSSEAELLQVAHVAVRDATAAKALLVPYGLTDALLEGLTADIAAYEAALERQRQALASQVGARGELKGVVADLMRAVKNLDAIHRLRFQKNRELRTAWKSVRHMPSPAPEPVPVAEQPSAPAPVPAPAPAPVVPSATDTTRAA